MKTVKEVSELTGVSVRALHHYDAIGLLRPTRVTEAGYRPYDGEALKRLWTILLFRELDFPLAAIRAILDNPATDRENVLNAQIELLEMRRNRLDGVIRLAKNVRDRGGEAMSFQAFDREKQKEYARRAKETWGGTEAYREFEKKDAGRAPEEKEEVNEGLMRIFREFGGLLALDPADAPVQAQVKALKDYITKHFYDCKPEILAGLGQMYAAGGEMTQNIDAAGGKGTAEFVGRAIEIFVKH